MGRGITHRDCEHRIKGKGFDAEMLMRGWVEEVSLVLGGPSKLLECWIHKYGAQNRGLGGRQRFGNHQDTKQLKLCKWLRAKVSVE